MKKVLYISASPRGELSGSIQAAQIFTEALGEDANVRHIDLAARALPEVTAEVASAKVKTFMGIDLTDEESRQWAAIVELVEEFAAADHYLISLPMWNYSVPYKFKQYVDLITHPGLTFGYDAGGHKGLMDGRATLIFCTGGNYGQKDGKLDPLNFQTPFLRGWLSLIGVEPTAEVVLQNTAMGPEAVSAAVEGAREQLVSLAQSV